MPDDVYFKYPPQLLAVHVPLLEHVVDRRKANPTQIQLSINPVTRQEIVTETTLRIRGDTMQLFDERMEVLFSIHYRDGVRSPFKHRSLRN